MRLNPPSPGAARSATADEPATSWPDLLRRWRWPLVWTVLALLLVAWGVGDNARLFFLTVLNGLTLAALYFLVASGFTLIFGLMRNVNLAHGSLFLLGAYVGYSVGEHTGSWVLALISGFASAALAGVLMQVLIFRHMEGEDLRQTLVTIGLSIVMADIFLWVWGGDIYQFEAPQWLTTPVPPAGRQRVRGVSPVRAGRGAVDGHRAVAVPEPHPRRHDGACRRRRPQHAGGERRQRAAWLFAVTFAVGAGLAGFAGVIGGTALSIAPGEDVRYLLASLVVVIVGGMGSISGAAVGALLIGMAQTFGQAYAPTYGVVFTFVIMVVVLAFRPQGLMGRPA